MPLLSVLLTILIICLFLGMAIWILDLIPVPPPMNQIAKAICAVFALIMLVGLLFGVVPRIALT